MPHHSISLERRQSLRGLLQADADMLHRRLAREVPADRVDDYVELNWLEWWGGTLRLTTTGENICRQGRTPVELP